MKYITAFIISLLFTVYSYAGTSTPGYTLYGLSGSVTLQTTKTDALSATTDSASGMELINGKLSILQGCADNEIMKWDETEDDWNCEADAGAAGGDSVSIDSVGVVDPDFQSTDDIDFIDTANVVTAAINANIIDFADILYTNTLAGNPALLADECFPLSTATGGGFICEGSTANTNEQLYLFPDADGVDTTEYIVVADDANVSAAEAGYLDGVTSAIQTQIDSKEGTLTNEAGLETAIGGTDVVTVTTDDISSANLITLMSDESGTGVLTMGTSATHTTPLISGKIDADAGAVNDDDCTGEIGLFWFDDTDNAFEFCNADSGAPTTLGGGSSNWTDGGAFLHPLTDGDTIRARDATNPTTEYIDISHNGTDGIVGVTTGALKLQESNTVFGIDKDASIWNFEAKATEDGSDNNYFGIRGNRSAGLYVHAEIDDFTAGDASINLGVKIDAGDNPERTYHISHDAITQALEIGYRDAAWGGFGDNPKLTIDPQGLRWCVDADTIADTGDANPATATLNPTCNKVHITCNDADTCDVTMGETNANEGDFITIINISANVVDIADTVGVSETSGVFAMGQYDSITLDYIADRWVERNRSNN